MNESLALSHYGRRPMAPESSGERSPRLLTALSTREAQILEHVAAGRSNREIAELLHLGENTVKYHLKSIHAKLGAKRRTDALRIATAFGLIDLDPQAHPPSAKLVPAGGHHRLGSRHPRSRCAHCGR